MKRVFIPKGEVVTYDELHTEILIVKGVLKVIGKLTAKSIQGGGNVEAEEIICDDISLNTVTADIVTATKIAVKKLLVRDCRAAVIVATDFIECLSVQANKLTMSLSAISVCNTDDVIVLPQKTRGMLGMLFAAWLRSLFLARSVMPKKKAAKKRKTSESKEASSKCEETSEISDRLLDAVIQALENRGYIMGDIKSDFRSSPQKENLAA